MEHLHTTENIESSKNIHLPDKWKDWTVVKLLGRGSYGSVYLLEKETEPERKSRIALKVIRIPEDTSELELLLREYMTEEATRNYFTEMAEHVKNEISIMMEVKDHPNVVQLQDYELEMAEDGFGFYLYMQMEYLTTLPLYQEQHYLEQKDYIKIAIELCEALEYCEERNLIHRDIKPDNIMLTEDGRAKLGDFGLARYLDHNKRYMSIKGSTAYMAPEVFHGKKYDHRADQYSLGLTIYRELNGRREPFVSQTKNVISYQEKEKANKLRLDGHPIQVPSNCTWSMWKILKKTLEPSPDERYDDTKTLKEDLLRLQKGTFKGPQLNKRQTKRMKLILGLVLTVFIGMEGLEFFGGYISTKKEQERQKREEFILEYDQQVWDVLGKNDYEEFHEVYTGYSQEDFEALREECYREDYTQRIYSEAAERDGNIATEVLHYKTVGKYPDPNSRIEAVRLSYQIQKKKGFYYLMPEDSDLLMTQLSRMPQGYQDSALAGRNTEEYAFASLWSEWHLTIPDVVGFEVTSLWQNEDRSLSAQILVMNGTNRERVINDMDYTFTDEKLGVIAQGNYANEYTIEPGMSITFTIPIPAEEVQTGWNTWNKVECLFEPNID